MANEIDSGSSTNETIAAEIVDREMIPAAYGNNPILQLVKHKDMTGENSLVSEHVKWPDLTASVTAPGDGVDLSNVAVDTTSVSATVSERGVMNTITDLFLSASIVNVTDFAQQLGAAVGQTIESDLAAEFADLTDTTGTTTADFSHSNFLDAMLFIENAGVLDRGPIYAVMHPQQIFDLRTNIATSLSGSVFGSERLGADGPFQIGMSWGLYGVTIVSSRRLATANSDGDVVGAMFPAGNMSPFVYTTKWHPRSEFERDASLRGWEVVATAAYADECIDPAAGTKLVTDAP